MNKTFFPYIGGKNKLAGEISKRLHATGKKCLVDVFGGSGAVTMRSGFKKRIYNDINGDLVNLFRVMADEKGRMVMLKMLKWTPPSREIFDKDKAIHKSNGYSFSSVSCSRERARMTLYQHIFCFGGKARSGGFAVSVDDRQNIKEIYKYQNVLKELSMFGKFFSNTMIENLDFTDLIRKYGHKENTVFFVDPPYLGFDTYYSHNLSSHQHETLAIELLEIPAPVICTFYDHPLVRKLYPEELWKYEIVQGLKNRQQGGSSFVNELILTKRDLSQDVICRHIQRSNLQATMSFEVIA